MSFRVLERKKNRPEPAHEDTLYKGTLTVKVWGSDGSLKAVRGPMRNKIVKIGLSFICDHMGRYTAIPSTLNSVRWTGVGTGTTAATWSQTKLVTHKYRKKNTYTHTSGNKYFSNICTFTSFGGTRKATITEAGLLWRSTSTVSNCMLCRQQFSGVSKLSADTLTVEWRVSTTVY